MGDQPYWGDVVHRMGLGPKPIPQKRLTANLLASAISESVGDESKRVKAVELGEKLRSENGVMRAVEIVSERLGRSRS
jgi:sterol 3beta-glucosyltransferase